MSTSWDNFAFHNLPEGPLEPFSWTPYAGHGPGLELLCLNEGSTVLELGCGRGDRLVHCLEAGYRAVGVDVSAVAVSSAGCWGRRDWRLHHGDATHYLRNTTEAFDAVVSVFGAHWFTDPAALLPRVRARLREGGMVALAHVPPGDPDHSGPYADVPGGETVLRWEGESVHWAEALEAAGFERPTVTSIEPPYRSGGVRTVVITARVAPHAQGARGGCQSHRQ
ncbi:class I SAM-dependent methyltransferase [Streptomyces erythrochromogenes]|uniref:class I SAM-dependent methyltransferase n=1 Tax=Streptomyces erythrochromogenes TaxID=285574 RepID=UPI0036AE1450